MGKKFNHKALVRLDYELQALRRKIQAFVDSENATWKAHSYAWCESQEGRDARNAILNLFEVKGHLAGASDKLMSAIDVYAAMKEDSNA